MLGAGDCSSSSHWSYLIASNGVNADISIFQHAPVFPHPRFSCERGVVLVGVAPGMRTKDMWETQRKQGDGETSTWTARIVLARTRERFPSVSRADTATPVNHQVRTECAQDVILCLDNQVQARPHHINEFAVIEHWAPPTRPRARNKLLAQMPLPSKDRMVAGLPLSRRQERSKEVRHFQPLPNVKIPPLVLQ